MKEIKLFSSYLDENRHATLVKENTFSYGCDRFQNPADIQNMLNSIFRLNERATEYAYELCLDANGRLTAIMELSHGCVDGTALSPREVMMNALLSNAVKVVLVHNHPSGDVTPSSYDMRVFNDVVAAGKIMQIPLLDFIIIGGDRCNSFQESGLL